MIARTMLGRVLAVVLSVALAQIAAPIVSAAETIASAPVGVSHVVDSQQLAARMTAAAAERESNIALVQSVLSTAEAQKQATLMGVPLGRMRAAVPHLSDAELKDLSERAARVKDISAGHHGNAGLIILGVALLVAGLAVLAAVGDWDNDWDDDCWCD